MDADNSKTRDGHAVANALYDAVSSGDVSRAIEIIDSESLLGIVDHLSLNRFKDNALHHASRLGDVAMIDALLKKGMNVNSARAFGCMTPLHIACWATKADAALLLISAGADINMATDDGYTAMRFCAGNFGMIAVMKELIAAGADVNYGLRYGVDCLIAAADRNDHDAMVLLIKSGADRSRFSDRFPRLAKNTHR